MSLTHINHRGEAHMVDVGDKSVTSRSATATGFITMQPNTLQLLVDGALPKGDVLATARIAGIQAAKRTSDLIPLCHPLPLTHVSIDMDIDMTKGGIHVMATCRTDGKTGVEMEALTAVSATCLTLFDMCKAVDRRMVIGDIRVNEKTGGKSGSWSREDTVAPGNAVPEEKEDAAGSSMSTALLCVRFFGEARDHARAGMLDINIEAVEPLTVAGLKACLIARGDFDPSRLQAGRLMVAVNQKMTSEDHLLSPGDEVAFFPPVTGG
ncbi:cyclic pyranopterin monophosphate synthase MoaC [Larsenimonas rhizosphaerae]|uniref:Cyclic pyranopterin monophosphate synthase n=1 Tax=Larsenimonas rhizosphaerae TaxID=2944682 RepID=A0AA42CWW1_9GAMM|nr:cyclic pyranopterin monophosphate synthase MoaC [Larsenimonas rhizosphaerae]MCM2130455.1 cyclic pyranopterin monophosphate synthase MoaC [Larsenimonas rhizosphaerae]MCX2523160.1 cyclic pyranopterin monophosphate synthase MoaC [Larsenimonas rhizosphaerae]